MMVSSTFVAVTSEPFERRSIDHGESIFLSKVLIKFPCQRPIRVVGFLLNENQFTYDQQEFNREFAYSVQRFERVGMMWLENLQRWWKSPNTLDLIEYLKQMVAEFMCEFCVEGFLDIHFHNEMDMFWCPSSLPWGFEFYLKVVRRLRFCARDYEDFDPFFSCMDGAANQFVEKQATPVPDVFEESDLSDFGYSKSSNHFAGFLSVTGLTTNKNQ